MGKRTSFTVVARFPDGRQMTIDGRPAWTLDQLHRAGINGCTAISNPAPRWSHYVFKLRGMGLDIETVTEAHGGPFAGSHARYVLRSSISLVVKVEDQQREAA